MIQLKQELMNKNRKIKELEEGITYFKGELERLELEDKEENQEEEESCKEALQKAKEEIENLYKLIQPKNERIEELERNEASYDKALAEIREELDKAKANKSPKGIAPPLDQSLQDQIYKRAQELKAQDCKRIYATLQKEFPQVKSLATLHKYAKGNNNHSE